MAGRRSGTRWIGATALAVALAAAGLIGGSAPGLAAGPIAVPPDAVRPDAVRPAAVRPAAVRQAATAGIVTTDRAAVRAALVRTLRPALRTPIGWSGSASACRAGTASAPAQAATLAAINFFRAMGRLDPVALDPGMSAQAQQAALMMDANFALDHDPPSSWSCWSEIGADAAGQSNLCLGCTGAGAVAAYLSDGGDGNGAVGHRRWVMYPPTTLMGSGSTENANALMVFGSDAAQSANRPRWVSWPTPGYFPTELEPAGRWSLSASDPATSFAAAKVAVTTATGTAVRVTPEPVADGYGSNTLVWQVSGLKLPTGTTPRRIDVAVTGIRQAGTVVSRRYSVRLFNADARLKNTVAPRLTGTAEVGHMLRVRTGTWSPTATSYGYVWYRAGAPIDGADKGTYTLRAADAGARISVKVTARRGGYASGVHRTGNRTVAGVQRSR